jgi:hypothetical protein
MTKPRIASGDTSMRRDEAVPPLPHAARRLRALQRDRGASAVGRRWRLVHAAFEDHVGYLAQRSDKTAVSNLMRVAWTTVGDIVQRVVKRHQRVDPLDGLTHIGVDELSYGLHSSSALIALLKLCCAGIELVPVTLRPGSTH